MNSLKRVLPVVVCCAAFACGAQVADDGTSSGGSGTDFGGSGSSGAVSPGGFGSVEAGFPLDGGGVQPPSSYPYVDGGYDFYPDANSYQPPPWDPEGGVVQPTVDAGPVGGFRSTSNAPLPPAQNGGGFNAIYVAADEMLYLPLFSTPSCAVDPPYGEFYNVAFTPMYATPNGIYTSCYYGSSEVATSPCYTPGRSASEGERNDQNIAGGRFQLSGFDANGIATGAMDTQEGLVPLSVKLCL